MKLVQFDFKYAGPFDQEMTEAMDGLAHAIADEQSARDYMARHTERLKSFGIDKVNAKLFDVNVPLTQITRGPL